MGKLLKSLLIIIITLVIIAALAVGGIWAFCYFKYDVNVFSVASALNKISSVPEQEEVATNIPQDADYTAVMNKINDAFCLGTNKVITYNSETKEYAIEFGEANKILGTDNLILTDKESCALFNMILSSQDPSISTGSETFKLSDYDFQLLEFDFADHEIVTADGKTTIRNSFKTVSSISLLDVKKKMSTFPLSMLKGKVPDTIYIASTMTVIMEQGTISYEVESKALNLNKVTYEQIKPVFQLLNNFVKVGNADEFNKQIGSMFVNTLLGNSETNGFAYSLTTQEYLGMKVAQSFAFTPTDGKTVLTIYGS